jgi:Tfp pilus assembly protein FimV
VGDSKTYVVRAGDSLWLIAKRMLPPNASNAEIARMVNQLWTMNASRIRTGNPNLLGVGVVLALP